MDSPSLKRATLLAKTSTAVFGNWKLLGWFGELKMIFTAASPFFTSSRLRCYHASKASPSASPSMSCNDISVDSAFCVMLVSLVILEKCCAIDFVPLVRPD